jgi:hypothetical protein
MNLKITVFHQLQPPFLTHVQISLSENVLQALVVSEDMNYIPQKIVPPCPQGKDNSSQLKIMRGIVLFIMTQLSWGIRNHSPVLHKNTTKPSSRCITINIKGLGDVWLCQHKRCSQQLLQCLKCFITLCILNKLLLFLQKISVGFGNIGEVRDESKIIASQSEKTADLMDSPWRPPIQHNPYHARIHRHSLWIYHVT